MFFVSLPVTGSFYDHLDNTGKTPKHFLHPHVGLFFLENNLFSRGKGLVRECVFCQYFLTFTASFVIFNW